MYVIATFIYFVGLLTFYPAAMTVPNNSPVAYAALTIFCLFAVLLVVSLISWAFFWSIRKLAGKYLTALSR